MIRLKDAYDTKVLKESDLQKVYSFLMKMKDYFMIIKGRWADLKDAKELFLDLPPGKTLKDKFLIGIWKDEKMIGLVDLVRQFPDKDTWMIGELLIDTDYRRQGIGQMVHTSIAHWVKSEGGKKLRIGVVKENEIALIFWKTQGYEVEDEVGPIHFGDKKHDIIKMEKRIF